uniref:Retrotransposon gag domain-containing protein n=1 Tax=Ananas comosus var. bracteatus TaxID=296719 RepID=A0A6V7P9M0_ANACO|nr:unnamed protein product [Ananas comosus var. bracteatus]
MIPTTSVADKAEAVPTISIRIRIEISIGKALRYCLLFRRIRSVYKATSEQLSVLDIFCKPPTRKTKSTPTMSADEQIVTPSDLAAKITALSNDMKTVLDWIKAQSAAQSAMPVEKSGRLAETPRKARVTSVKGAVEDTLGVRDDDNSDDDGSIAPSVAEMRLKPFKVEAKIEIPNYDGIVDAEKLDAWLDQLEMYFDLYNYSNALKEFCPIGYEEERWKRWHVLRQRHDQTVQDYTTDFRRQALALGISLDDPQVFSKYTAGLQERINGELRLFGIRDIASASQTVMAIEQKNKLSRGEKPSRESAKGSNKFKKNGSKNKGSFDPDLYCDYCKVTKHVKDRCWKLHPELKPKKKDDRGKRTNGNGNDNGNDNDNGRIDK